MPHRSCRSRPRRSGWRLKPERSNPSILCRRVLGSSPAPLSQRSLLNPSPNGRGKIQSTPQDRILTSKTSSHQSHSQMGVPMHGCSSSRKIAADGENAARRTRQRGQDIPAGSNRSPFRNIRSATAIAARLADPECSSPEGGEKKKKKTKKKKRRHISYIYLCILYSI